MFPPSSSSSSLSSRVPLSHTRAPTVNAETSGANTPLTDTSEYEDAKDVAIVGMACRVAGGNNSPEQVWQSLLDGKDASGSMPSMRWEPYHSRDPRNTRVLDETTSRGYYLDHLEDFDAQFFGISPMEAEQMDPQQRISLEVAWEALENAGIPSQHLSGSDTAVFWGVNSDDYSKLLLEDLPNIEAWMGIGTAYCGVPNRISYHLNLSGPSTAVDAACASSLVAVHHGAQAILTGESRVAIVGGVNALCGPGLFRSLDKAGALSPEGRCQSFDDDAHGYGRGEGAAAIVLKDMTRAIRDGDNILAVVKGTAVGHDGKTNGIMAPNAEAQASVCRRALEVAGVVAKSVRYVEAHATSTPLGDPTEISALASVYGIGRIEDPCLIGSIKPNIGHLEAGAGAMGLIKAVMALKKGLIPPQTNLNKLTERIDWDTVGLKVVQEATPWPQTDSIRRAAVSSYGYGGTVSHAIIQEFTPPERLIQSVSDIKSSQDSNDAPVLLLLSGRQEKRLALEAGALRQWMQHSNTAGHSLNSIAATLALRRDHHEFRAALVIQDNKEALQTLAQLEEGVEDTWITHGRIMEASSNKDIVWVFSGHGAQWTSMGKDLINHKIFHRAVEPLDRIVFAEMGVSPIDMLRSGDFASSDHIQVLTYIMQIGISAILNSLGIFPRAVIGHSVGEIAASVIAGATTAEEGAFIVTRRAILYRQVMGKGAMILVCKPSAKVSREILSRCDLVVAIDTSPSSCVVSGSAKGIAEATLELKQQGVRVFKVDTDIAFHSPSLGCLADPLLAALDGSLFPTLATRAKLYSTSLEDPRGQNLRNSEYWANNMVNPVRLTSAVKAAMEDSYCVFMEISSHPVILHSINETMMDADFGESLVLPTLMRGKPAEKMLKYAVAQLHCRGVPVDWTRQMDGPWATDLPNTQWIHRPTWRKIKTMASSAVRTHDVNSHTLLGGRVQVAGSDIGLHTTTLDQNSKPFPQSHPLHGTEIVPAACLLNTFLKSRDGNILEKVSLRVPLAINAPRHIQVISTQNEIKILSRLIQQGSEASEDSSWVTHTTSNWATGSFSVLPPDQIDIPIVKLRVQTRLEDNFTIEYLRRVGVSEMGFPWAVKEHYGNTSEMLAKVSADPSVADDAPLSWDQTSWAPALDAATSVGSTLFFDNPKLRMPAQVERVEIFTKCNPPKMFWLYVQEASGQQFTSHVSILDEAGHVLAKLVGMRFSEIEGTPGLGGGMDSLVHQIAWVPAEKAKKSLSISSVVLISNDADLSAQYAKTIPNDIKTLLMSSAPDMSKLSYFTSLGKDAVIVYIPSSIQTADDIGTIAEAFTWEVLEILKFIIHNSIKAKLFVLTCNAGEAKDETALACAPLIGLSRVLFNEHPDQFGGLIDNEALDFPLSTMQSVCGVEIIRIRQGLATTARLRILEHIQLLPSCQASQLLPRPGGTYLITGGIGALGLAVSSFLVDNGARRLILVSRRCLPPRKTWRLTNDNEMRSIISKIEELEMRGASIHVLALDISGADAADELSDALERLSWPPVLGVVHAAGVLDNQLALETTKDAFSRVLAPKIAGGLALHEAFPPGSVEFFILFSSCGQLVGFTGQSSYGSANSFLDALATHRRAQGDRAVSLQWTSWRGMGMASSTEFINAELESKGITDVTVNEAFGAWKHISKYDIDHGVVLRSLVIDKDDISASAILQDIAIRQQKMPNNEEDALNRSKNSLPESAEERKAYFHDKICHCVAHVLHMDAAEVDSKTALSDLGVDSVLTVTLRSQLQQTLRVKIPPTLTWSHPTIKHLVEWFMERLNNE